MAKGAKANGLLTVSGEYAKHMGFYKRPFWKAERRAASFFAENEADDVRDLQRDARRRQLKDSEPQSNRGSDRD